jgi:hypothetical protein
VRIFLAILLFSRCRRGGALFCFHNKAAQF